MHSPKNITLTLSRANHKELKRNSSKSQRPGISYLTQISADNTIKQEKRSLPNSNFLKVTKIMIHETQEDEDKHKKPKERLIMEIWLAEQLDQRLGVLPVTISLLVTIKPGNHNSVQVGVAGHNFSSRHTIQRIVRWTLTNEDKSEKESETHINMGEMDKGEDLQKSKVNSQECSLSCFSGYWLSIL